MVALTEDERFEALARRDAGLRDAFVVGVVTTGVYCRAGCPARTPRRENLRFYDTADQARAAGFRPCLRCRPDQAAPGTDVVERAARMIDESETAPSLAELAKAVGLSGPYLQRLFKAHTGVSPAAYAAQVRDRRAKTALENGASVTQAVFDAGYGAPSRFYDTSHARFGMTPSAWRRGGEGETIRAAIAPCSLGHVLVAATDIGVCLIELGDDPDLMLERLRARFDRAEVRAADAGLEAMTARVLEIIDNPADPGADLPLDVRGTAFQQKVWRALRDIPPGETRSYGQLAATLGRPGAARAVGAACGANPVSLLTPCHRAVGADGSLTGFAWGMARKRELLRRERGQG